MTAVAIASVHTALRPAMSRPGKNLLDERRFRRTGLGFLIWFCADGRESFPGHFGIGGLKWAREMTEWFFHHTNIDWVLDAVLEKVTPGGSSDALARAAPHAGHIVRHPRLTLLLRRTRR